MAYTPQTWNNNDKTTPLSAERMTVIENGLVTIDTVAANAFTKASTNETNIAALQAGKQDNLVSGTNIKTLNNESLLGEGNIEIIAESEHEQFKINGIACNDIEVKLPVGAVYELSGYLEGHILVEAEGAGTETEVAANTQLILNNLTVKSDTDRAIYSNQTQKKLVITTIANTKNYFESMTAEGELLSSAVIEAENSLYIETGKNSLIEIKSNCQNHAVKAQSLYLDGAGEIDVDAAHDGFHGSKILRVSSGTYKVFNAKDAFEAANSDDTAGDLQILGGNINVIKCAEDAFDAKIAGVIAGYDTTITLGEVAGSRFGSTVKVLETVNNISGYTVTKTTLADYFGTAIVKAGSATGADIELDENNKYTTSETTVYVKGYIEHPIVLTSNKTDIIFDQACIVVEDADTAIQYTPTKNKLAFKPDSDVDSINYIINTGAGYCVKSKNFTVQRDASFIFKSAAANIYAFETTLRGDGVKILNSDAQNIDCTTLYLGADKDDIAAGEEFCCGSVICNNDILCEVTRETSDPGAVFVVYSQQGAVVCNDIRANLINNFYLGGANSNIQVPHSICLTKLRDFVIDDLRVRVRALEVAIANLEERLSKSISRVIV